MPLYVLDTDTVTRQQANRATIRQRLERIPPTQIFTPVISPFAPSILQLTFTHKSCHCGFEGTQEEPSVTLKGSLGPCTLETLSG